MREKNLKLNSLDNSVIGRHPRRLWAEMESLLAVTRNPFKDFHTQVVNPLRDLRIQTELRRDPLKEFRDQMAEVERIVNPVRDLRIQTELRRDPLKEFRDQMAEVERIVNPVRDLRIQTELARGPWQGFRDQMERFNEVRRMVDSSRDLRSQMELARDPFKEFGDQMGRFDKSIVNFTHMLDEIVKPTIPFVSKLSVGIDVFIEPEYPEIGEQPVRIHCPDNPNRPFGEKVFIVCGKDEEAKQTVARWVEKLGLEVVITDEKPSGALTRIEKVERYSDDVTFTVVLLTPDDIGKPKDELGESNFRASQDVILQLGLLIGKYGRDQICFLYKGELELPSGMDGVNLIPMDANGGWILNLIREMEAVGLSIDLHKAI